MDCFTNRRLGLFGVAMFSCALTCILILGGFALKSDGRLYIPWRRTSQDGPFLIPDDEQLDKLNETEMKTIYWRYINTLQTLCRNQARLGSLGDGGKEICVDSDYRPRRPCLVYSFGSNNQFDFELGIIDSFGCELHTFDPTMKTGNSSNSTIPAKVHFHDVGLDGRNHVTREKWRVKTLDTIIQDLGHAGRTIDILKIDIEGTEWPSFTQMLQAGTLQRANQLLVEFHFLKPEKDCLKVLRGIYDTGFRIFMRERNLVFIGDLLSEFNTRYAKLTELSFVRVRS